MPRDAWRRLGIAPTDDVRAIRRAYADRLRELDADADPDVFMGLRDARDVALANPSPENDGAAGGADDVDGWGDDGWYGHNLPIVLDPQIATWQSRPTPFVPTPDGRVIAQPANGGEPSDALASAPPPNARPRSVRPSHAENGLLSHLFGQRPQRLMLANEVASATHYLNLIADDAAASTIDHFGQIDAWLIDMLATSTPRSDVLIPVADRLFGWSARPDDHRQVPGLSRLLARGRARDFIAAVTRRGHPLSRAWHELMTPAVEGSARGFVRRRNVERLLATVRRDHPFIEDDYFDGWRVGLWEGPRTTGGCVIYCAWTITLLFLLWASGVLG